jgi:hypothetical protein
MTNIMAYVNNELPMSEQGELFPYPAHFGPNAVVMADGLASGNGEVSGGHQKVFAIGNKYLLGTGSAEKIKFIASEVEAFKDNSPKRLGQRIIDLSKKYFEFANGDGLNFMVVGRERGNLRTYEIRLNNLNKPIPGSDSLTMDGSGSAFVQKALQRDWQRGLMGTHPGYDTIADLTTRMFDFGHVAQSSVGVNDELQYGFITREGNATLIHPRVGLTHPTKEYLENGNMSQKKVDYNAEFYEDLSKKLGATYNVTKRCNRITTEMLSNDPRTQRRLSEWLDEGRQDLRALRTHINRMIMNYVAKHNQT